MGGRRHQRELGGEFQRLGKGRRGDDPAAEFVEAGELDVRRLGLHEQARAEQQHGDVPGQRLQPGGLLRAEPVRFRIVKVQHTEDLPAGNQRQADLGFHPQPAQRLAQDRLVGGVFDGDHLPGLVRPPGDDLADHQPPAPLLRPDQFPGFRHEMQDFAAVSGQVDRGRGHPAEGHRGFEQVRQKVFDAPDAGGFFDQLAEGIQ